MTYSLVVVGAGLYGLTISERVANELGLKVLLIDRRGHVGGNAFSTRDRATGVEIHQYGSHIFHTSNERVWRYVNSHTQMNEYRHRVYTVSDGEVYSLPINLGTINHFFRACLGPESARALLARDSEGKDPRTATNLEDKAVATIGRQLYEAFIKGYTQKQWQTSPRELPPEVISRLPVRFTYDNRYFSDRYEGIPEQGYGAWLERMAASPLIDVMLETDFFEVRGHLPRVPVIYTGPIDRYFDYSIGHLSWRTLDFELQTFDIDDFQGTSVMNYADVGVPYTRVHEFKHFHPEWQSRGGTVVMREYSRFASPADEPYYPVNGPQDRDLIRRYRLLAAAEPDVFFGGRLGTYQYLDMHMAIASALTMYEQTVRPLLLERGQVKDAAG